jgi:hypothetical protein
MATNLGESDRSDITANCTAKRAMDAQLANGEVAPDSVHVVDPGLAQKFCTSFGKGVACRLVDGIGAGTSRG